jgi:hypothetical protein
MLKILFDIGVGEDVVEDARRLHRQYMTKNNMPRVAGVERALIPTYCYHCDEKTWGTMQGYGICEKCRGEGKLPIGFG